MTAPMTREELADKLDAIFDRIEVSCNWRLSSEERQEIAEAAKALRGVAQDAPKSWPDLTWWEAASINAEFVGSLGEWKVTFKSPRGADWRDAGISLRAPPSNQGASK